MTLNPKKRLRIAVLNRNFSPRAGGAERYSLELVRLLAEKHEMHVFAQTIEHPSGGPLPGVVYHQVSMPMRKPRWVNQLWFATTTWWATRSGQGFDVVHSHENTWHGDVQTVHVLPVKHNLLDGRSGLRRALRWLKVVTSPRLLVYLGLEKQRYATQPGRAVVLTSDSLLSIFKRTYPDAAGMCSVITPGIELPESIADTSKKQAARQQLGLPPDGRCLLFVGNDLRKKGLQALLQAMPQLPADENGHLPVLAVVGSSARQLQPFQQQAESAGLAGRVFFLGALTDMTPAYQAADLLAHPTLEDTFAMVVLEAMSFGLPVVVSSSKYCGISGLLTDGENALILEDPRDAAKLAQTLTRLLDKGSDGAADQTPLAQRLGYAARQWAAQHQWRDIEAQQDALYQTVVAAKTGST